MNYEEKILFIRTTNHIVQINFDKYNSVGEFLIQLSKEITYYCESTEKIERIMVCKTELRN